MTKNAYFRNIFLFLCRFYADQDDSWVFLANMTKEKKDPELSSFYTYINEMIKLLIILEDIML